MVTAGIAVVRRGGAQLAVMAPKSANPVLRALGGRYDRRARCWRVPASPFVLVAALEGLGLDVVDFTSEAALERTPPDLTTPTERNHP
ncbi:MAG: hypothetical protein Q8R60_08810 [Mycobacteriales bacterium]|nr:hypothetical protein [Mycobacteriales bacterium]